MQQQVDLIYGELHETDPNPKKKKSTVWYGNNMVQGTVLQGLITDEGVTADYHRKMTAQDLCFVRYFLFFSIMYKNSNIL